MYQKICLFLVTSIIFAHCEQIHTKNHPANGTVQVTRIFYCLFSFEMTQNYGILWRKFQFFDCVSDLCVRKTYHRWDIQFPYFTSILNFLMNLFQSLLYQAFHLAALQKCDKLKLNNNVSIFLLMALCFHSFYLLTHKQKLQFYIYSKLAVYLIGVSLFIFQQNHHT